MSNGRDFDKACVYQIKVKGNLASNWSDWFDGFTFKTNNLGDETLLTGQIEDQAALYGLLAKLGGIGIPLLSVIRLDIQND